MEKRLKDYVMNMNPIAKKEAIVTGRDYRFTVLTDCLIRLEYQKDGLFVDKPTQTVVCRDFPSIDYRVIEKDDSLEIVTDKLHLYYDKKPFTREGLSIQLKQGYHVYGSVWNFGDEINDLKGTARTLDCIDGATELESSIMSREGFTVLDDSKTALMTEEGWVTPKENESIDLYFFGYGHDYVGCLKDFYCLCGEVPLLPRFTMGNWWSRYYRYTEESYLELMDKFQEKEVPFAVSVIDMDWHLTEIPAKYGSGWTGYTWNPEYFPNPKRFMDKLHEKGLHVTLNVHPADGVRAHEKAYLPMAKELGIDYENEDKIPFDIMNKKFVEAYFKYLHHPNEEDGVDFWWLDWQQGNKSSVAGIDALWMLNYLHFMDSGRDGKVPLTFSRYAGIGSHRFPIGFSGDTYATWDSLDFQPYFTVNASNAGYSWWSHDIGGHQGGRRDDELVVRWVQFGIFSPIMRLHSTSNEFYGKEPWNYNVAAEQIITNFLQLRHKLIPYLYSMNYRTHLEGIPLMQPMYYLHDTPEAYEVKNQYYFGSQMIVCPITKPVDKETLLAPFEAWLPEGDYFDFFTGCHYKGGRKITLYRNQESIPVLVRSGGIVPMAKDYKKSHICNPKELEVFIYNGSDGMFEMYEDRCEEKWSGKPVLTRFTYKAGETAEILIQIEGNTEGVIPKDRSYDICVKGIEEPSGITFSNQAIEFTQSYDADKKEVHINFTGAGEKEFRIGIQSSGKKIVANNKEYAIYKLLHRAQIEYNLKAGLYDEICKGENTARLLGKIQQMGLDKTLEGAVYEQIVAED